MPYVSEVQFQVGNTWVWAYSQATKNPDQWDPYYFEKYTVVAREGTFVTIDMVSWSAQGGVEGEPHHRIGFNLRNCGPRNKMPSPRGVSIVFWTKPPGSVDWQLVSKRYSSLAFTEKFNCYNNIGLEPVVQESKSTPIGVFETMAFRQKGHVSGNSFYAIELGALHGVAVEKLFHPHRNYRFQLHSAKVQKSN